MITIDDQMVMAGFVQCKYLVSKIRGEKCKARYGKVQLGLGDCESGWEKKRSNEQMINRDI